MAFTVEDGTGLDNSTSLCDVQFADDHLSSTGYAEDWANFAQGTKEARLEAATRMICSGFDFRGCIEKETQALAFPRKNLRDREGRLVTGNPTLVKIAVAELAYKLSGENFLTDAEMKTLNAVRVGPISLDVSSEAKLTKHVPDSVIRYLSEFGSYRFGRRRQRELRGG